MPVAMSKQKKPAKNKRLKTELAKELSFIKNVFSLLTVPMQQRVENDEDDLEDEIVNDSTQRKNIKEPSVRAHSITELEEKLEKIKSQNKFTLKNKLVKKSLSSKLNKIKKREKINKTKIISHADAFKTDKSIIENKGNVNIAKPVFNNDGKLVFSKFDFANNIHREKTKKSGNDPKKLLDNLKQQEEKIRHLEQTEEAKAKEIKEKVAWKTVLQKAEGQKVKDDPTLLKKSIKKLEQKKKHSKKQWDSRVKSVEQKKAERQKKRKENISKKKKEKKSKIVKAAVKRGRVVI